MSRKTALKTWGFRAVALLALVVVARSVPLRDRCADPASPSGPKVALVRGDDGTCTLRSDPPRTFDAAACGALVCEPGVASSLAHARLGVVLALGLATLASTVLWASRWRILLGPAGVRTSVRATWRVTLEALAGGVLLPGGLAGDALRLLRMRQVAPDAPLAKIVSSLFVDRLVGLSTVVLSALAVAWAGGTGDVKALTPLLVGAAGTGLGGVALLRGRLGAWAMRRLGRKPGLRGGLRGALAYVRDRGAPRALAAAFAVSLLVSISQLAIVRALLPALGASPTDEGWYLAAVTFGFVANAIPALPGGWGTSDAVVVYFAPRAGVAPGTMLSAWVVYRLYWYVVAAVGAVVGAAQRTRGASASDAA